MAANNIFYMRIHLLLLIKYIIKKCISNCANNFIILQQHSYLPLIAKCQVPFLVI